MINHLKTLKMNGTIRALFLTLLLSTMMPAAGQTAGKNVQTKVIAHRGYWKTDGSAQNSVTSFLKADSIGSYGSELDVWLTADSVLIANHDRVFKGLAMETSLSGDILATRLGNGEYIPSFEAILGAMRKTSGTRLILEIKNLKDKSKYPYEVGLVARLLEKYGVADRTEIIVFAHELGTECIRQMPGTRVFHLNGDLTPAELKERGYAGMDRRSTRPRAGSQCLDGEHAGRDGVFPRSGRRLHHDGPTRTASGVDPGTQREIAENFRKAIFSRKMSTFPGDDCSLLQTTQTTDPMKTIQKLTAAILLTASCTGLSVSCTSRGESKNL